MAMELKKILALFIGWRLLLFIILLFAIQIVPLQFNFLGGGIGSYLQKPHLWAWINFDGEHYLSIAYQGYQPLTYFYFPAYPILTRFIAMLLNDSIVNFALVGLLVSNLAFVAGMIGLVKLISLDYKKEIGAITVYLLLLFPTSFYFASFYTESLFFALAVWFFYFARRRKWVWVGVAGLIASATRLIGISLIVAILAEGFLQRKQKNFSWLGPILASVITFLGIGSYMYFLNIETRDPLQFFHLVEIFGQQRSSDLILLPQVFYRYFFKILPSLNYSYLPNVFTSYLEIAVGTLFLILTILGFWKLRASYAFFLLLGYIIPALSGSFSSLPRYVLILFPAYLLTANLLYKKHSLRIVVYVVLFILLAVSTALFVRGYWVS